MPNLTHDEIGAYFRAQRGVVYRWALLLCRNPDDARELVQDVFVRMLQQPPQRGSSVPQVLRWLRVTTQRLAIDRWRRRDRQPQPQVLQDRSAPASTAIDFDTSERLRAALAELTEPQRLVLLARVCDEWSFPQIARDLDISESTAKTHYVRGLRALRISAAHRRVS